jgi:hypothetical protein
MLDLRIRRKIGASDCAGFLFVRQARKGAHTGVCNSFRNAADGQKDKQDGAPISRRILKTVLAAALAMATCPAAFAETSTRWSMGGNTQEFASDVERADQSGKLFRITGHCQSACTMFLAVRNVCVEPSARLLFHAGQHPAGTARMLNSYNGRLRAYLEAHHAMESREFHTISGYDIIHKFGYRACP